MDDAAIENIFQEVNRERGGRGAANLSGSLKAKVKADVAATEAYIARTPALQTKFAALGADERAENVRQYTLDLADFQDRTGRLDKYPPMDPHLADLMTTKPVMPARTPVPPAPVATVTPDKLWASVQKLKTSRNADVKHTAVMLDGRGEAEAKAFLSTVRDAVIQAKALGQTDLKIVLTDEEVRPAVKEMEWRGNRRAFLREAAISSLKWGAGILTATIVAEETARYYTNSYLAEADRATRSGANLPPREAAVPQTPPPVAEQPKVDQFAPNPFEGRGGKAAPKPAAGEPPQPTLTETAARANANAAKAEQWRKGSMIAGAATGGILVLVKGANAIRKSVGQWWGRTGELTREGGQELGNGLSQVLQDSGLDMSGIKLTAVHGRSESIGRVAP
jgi:hypothetical protein